MGRPKTNSIPDPNSKQERVKAEVRAEYETTDLSLRVLAARHGIKSTTTITRWISRETWIRDPDGNRARIIKQAVKGTELDQEPPQEPQRAGRKRNAHTQNDAVNTSTRPRVNTSTDAHTEAADAHPDDASRTQNEMPKSGGGRPRARQHLSQRTVDALVSDDGEASELEIASEKEPLKDVHARGVRRQLRVAARLGALAGTVMNAIEDVLLAEYGSEEFTMAKMRLACLSEGGESMAGLLKAVAAVAEKAVVLERRALGQEQNSDPLQHGRGIAVPAGYVAPPAADLMENMPTDVLMQIRSVAVMVAKLPPGRRQPPVVDGAAEPVPVASPQQEE